MEELANITIISEYSTSMSRDKKPNIIYLFVTYKGHVLEVMLKIIEAFKNVFGIDQQYINEIARYIIDANVHIITVGRNVYDFMRSKDPNKSYKDYGGYFIDVPFEYTIRLLERDREKTCIGVKFKAIEATKDPKKIGERDIHYINVEYDLKQWKQIIEALFIYGCLIGGWFEFNETSVSSRLANSIFRTTIPENYLENKIPD